MVEGSPIAANRLFNSVFRFQIYPMTRLNQLRAVVGNWLDAMGRGTLQQKVAHTEQLVRFLFGTTLQGVLTIFFLSLAYEGVTGVRIRANEAKDNLAQFLIEAFMATMSGPLYLLWRGAQQRGLIGAGEQLTRVFFPYGMTSDFMDMAHGTGKYKDLDIWSRVGKFLESKVPMARAAETALATIGLANAPAKRLDAAISGFYRWRRDKYGAKTFEDWARADERAQFRTYMREAVEALKRGDAEAYLTAISKATGEARDRRLIAQSLRQRRILKRPDGKRLTPPELEELRNRIGDDAFEALVWWDLMLDKAADGLILPQLSN
jgi:hypothetical protein